MVSYTHSFLNGILDDPASYWIKNTTGYCDRYDSPDIDTNYASYGYLPIREYLWYNTGHIAFRVHELLAVVVGKFLERRGVVEAHTLLNCIVQKKGTDKVNSTFLYASKQAFWVSLISPLCVVAARVLLRSSLCLLTSLIRCGTTSFPEIKSVTYTVQISRQYY